MASPFTPSSRISWPRAQLALRCSGCLLISLAAWNFVPRPLERLEQKPALRVVLVDASASALRPQRAWLPWIRKLLEEQAERAGELGEEIALVSFAAEVGLAAHPAPPADFLERLRGVVGDPLDPREVAGERDASELARAMELAASLCLEPGRLPGRVVLAGCDGYTGPAPLQAIARLRHAQVPLEWLPAAPAHWHDLELVEMRIEPRLEAGAPIAALVRIDYTPGAARLEAAYLDVEITNGPELRNQRVELSLPALGGVFEQAIDCGPAATGLHRVSVRARLLPEPGDANPENDTLTGSTRAAGSKLILVTAREDRLPLARAWLAPTGQSTLAGIQFIFSSPLELGALLGQVDALISFDLALDQLPAAPIEAFVQRGGGFFVCAGWGFLGAWSHGQPDRGLAALLPVTPEPRQPEPRDVLLLVDGSGSMAGEPFESVRSACLDLVQSSVPEDRVLLRFFTVDLHGEHVIKPRVGAAEHSAERAREAAKCLLEVHVPKGSTHILESLENYAAELQSSSTETLLFVLTDGIELDRIPDLEARAQRLHADLLQAKVRIIPIAIGAKHDLDFMRRLARPGQDVALPEGLEALRALFRREISSARWREDQAAELALAWAPAESGELVRELRGIEAAELQPLQRLIRNRLKPWGEALWLADQGEPVLAAGRVGLGRVALLASVPGEDWAPRWMGQIGFGQPAAFDNLLRWIARRPPGSTSALELRQVGRELELSGLDERWPASFEARVLDALSGKQQELLSVEFAPPSRSASAGFLERRQGRITGKLSDWEGAAAVLYLEDPDGNPHVLPLELPRAPEFSGQEPLEREWFSQPSAGSGATPRGRAMGPNPAAPYLLAFGLLALFLGFARFQR